MYSKWGELMNEKIKEFFIKNYIALILGVGVIALFLWLVLWTRTDNRRISQIREQLTEIGNSQQTITSGLGDSTKQSATVTEGIGNSEERVRASQEQLNIANEKIGTASERLTEAGSLIKDCQSILKDVRRRAQERDSKN